MLSVVKTHNKSSLFRAPLLIVTGISVDPGTLCLTSCNGCALMPELLDFWLSGVLTTDREKLWRRSRLMCNGVRQRDRGKPQNGPAGCSRQQARPGRYRADVPILATSLSGHERVQCPAATARILLCTFCVTAAE